MRKFISLTTEVVKDGSGDELMVIIALCDDGSVWRKVGDCDWWLLGRAPQDGY